MSALTLYFINTTPGDTLSSDGSLQIGGTAPSVATSTSGWTVGTTAATHYSLFLFNTTRAASTFGTTALPSANPVTNDCLRSGNALTGTFAAGTWSVAISLKGLNANAVASGNLRVKFWHSPSRSGTTGATQIGSTTLALSSVTNLTSTAAQNTTGSISLPAATLNNEYLFVQFAWEIDTASTAATAGLVFVQDGTNSVITTPNFTVTGMSVIGNANTTFHGAGVTTTNFTTPTSPGTGNGPQAGDTLYALCNCYDVPGVTFSSPGWTAVPDTYVNMAGTDDALTSEWFSLKLTGAPSATYVFTISASTPTAFDVSAVCVRSVGAVDSGAGAPTTNNGGTGGGGTPTGLSLTTSFNNELVFGFFVCDETAITVGPTGYTTQIQNSTGGDGGFSFYGLYSNFQTTAGATGNLTVTNAGVTNWNTIVVALVSSFTNPIDPIGYGAEF